MDYYFCVTFCVRNYNQLKLIVGYLGISNRSDPTTTADVEPSMICDHKQHVIEKRFLKRRHL